MSWVFHELPNHLSERTRLLSSGRSSFGYEDHGTEDHFDRDDLPEGDFILYWMCTALRLEENPALDVARYLAASLKKPLLIYHSLSENYQFASDRHHTFILEGAADVQRQATQAGLSYVFYLQTAKDRQPHLIHLANQSAIVVTEDMPVDPPRKFVLGLLKRCGSPVVLVDTACVVPMQLVGQAFTRAYEFREATSDWYRQRVLRAWPQVTVNCDNFDVGQLPFQTLDLSSRSISDLVAACNIDHAVGPVRDTRGGSEAGYRRWRAFRENGLRHYSKRRNDALLSGVSRMSAYLHYGMVSPFRLAREAAGAKNTGAEKYLDELLIWRELAYAYCRYTPNHDSYENLPEWAKRTLVDHQSDPRPAIYDWETLARGQTDDRLWNAAQQSLLRHGELHNNLRMTWGKAILQWTRRPQEALQLMIDLNHRYALDGRDPASYGGILWCMGQFDRPFQPPQPILGTVRGRPTSEHAKRLDSHLYTERILAPRTNTSRKVAIIGAGISGSMAARTLADHGVAVTVFEKSRGVGGRMATRRMENGSAFDHGAQYFTVRDPRFERYVMTWIEQGLVGLWPDPSRHPSQRIAVIRQGRIDSWSDEPLRYVGLPSMNSVCHHLLREVPLMTETRVGSITKVGNQLLLQNDDAQELGHFDRVIISAPAPQAAGLLEGVSDLAGAIRQLSMQPCWAVMAEFAHPITNDWVGAFVHDSWITWIARSGTKPGRELATDKVTIHAEADWTAQNFESSKESVVEAALGELFRATSLATQEPFQATAHRWNYALVSPTDRLECCFDRDTGIVVCGDWTGGWRIEGAFLSGISAAGRVLGSFDEQPSLEANQQLRLFD